MQTSGDADRGGLASGRVKLSSRKSGGPARRIVSPGKPSAVHSHRITPEEGPEFAALGVPQNFVDALAKDGITRALPIQAQSIQAIAEGKDIVCQAPTGTGKTLAYLLPIMARIDWNSPELQALVMAPSHELVMQIRKVAQSLVADPSHVAAVVGAVPLQRQLEQLKRKPRLVVGSPGRVHELVSNRRLKVHTVKAIVVDEADKMMDSGFGGDVGGIVKGCLRDTQLVFVSATVSDALKGAIERMMKDHAHISTLGRSKSPESIRHTFITVRERDKVLNVKRILEIYRPPRSVIFINRNEFVMPLVGHLSQFGVMAGGLHSDLKDVERRAVMDAFRSGEFRALVTTDLFSRGLDVDGLDIVFNWDIPKDELKYLHRSGRTGRAGRKGLAVTFVTESQRTVPLKFAKKAGLKMEQCYLGHGEIVTVPTGRKVKGSKDSADSATAPMAPTEVE